MDGIKSIDMMGLITWSRNSADLRGFPMWVPSYQGLEKQCWVERVQRAVCKSTMLPGPTSEFEIPLCRVLICHVPLEGSITLRPSISDLDPALRTFLNISL